MFLQEEIESTTIITLQIIPHAKFKYIHRNTDISKQ